jgi:hypothetical protein
MANVSIRKVAMDACYGMGDTDYKYLGGAIRFANAGLRDLSLKTIPFIDKYNVRSEIIKVSSLGVAYMPEDFVYETKVGVCSNGRICIIAYDDDMCFSGDVRINCDCTDVADACGCVNTVLSGGSWGNEMAFSNVWSQGGYLGEVYGRGAQLNVYGFYKYHKKENYMTFKHIPEDCDIIVEYKSNGVGDGAALIPTEAESAIVAWINREFSKMKKDWTGYKFMDEEYKRQARDLENIYSAMNKYQYRDILLGASRSSVKR